MTIKAPTHPGTGSRAGRHRPSGERQALSRAPGLLGVLCTFAIALPLVGILASAGVVLLLLVATLLAAVIVWRAERRLPLPDRRLAAVFGVLLLWCAIASLWSFDPPRSLVLVVRIGFIFAAALALHAIVGRLDRPARLRIGGWLVAGVFLGLVILTVELTLGFPIAHAIRGQSQPGGNPESFLNRGAVAMAMLCWPAAAILWEKGARVAAVALIPVLLGILAFLGSLAAVAGVLAGAATVLVVQMHRKAGLAVMVLATLAALILSPLAGKQFYEMGWQDARWLPPSAAHRVEIWNFTVERIQEKPVFGWGFDAARGMARLAAPEEASGRSPIGLHPHNAPLQILLELGLIGSAIGLGVSWVLIQRLENRRGAGRVMGQAAYVAALAILCTGFGLWQNQWLALMASTALALTLTAASPAGRGAQNL